MFMRILDTHFSPIILHWYSGPMQRSCSGSQARMRVAFRIPVHIHTKHDNFSNAAQTTTLMKLTRFAFSLFESAVRVNYKWNSPMHVLCQLCGEDLIRILQRLDLLLTMLSGICKSCVLVHAFGLKLLTGQCVQVNRIFLCKSYWFA